MPLVCQYSVVDIIIFLKIYLTFFIFCSILNIENVFYKKTTIESINKKYFIKFNQADCGFFPNIKRIHEELFRLYFEIIYL